MPQAAQCRDCKRDIFWVKLPSGKHMPIDPEALPQPGLSLVAFNDRTGGGKVLSIGDMVDAENWAAKGVTFHRSHMFTCPVKTAYRRKQ